MSRTQFLTVALALVVFPASLAAEAPVTPVASPAAAAATASPSAQAASIPAAAVAATPAAKRQIVLGPEGVDDKGRVGRLHTVTRGDTLWDVSEAYLGTPWVWPSVWTDNHAISNPHLIQPGDRIWITADEMRVVSADEADAFLERRAEEPAAAETDMAAEPMTEEFPPEVEETVAEEPLLAAVPPTTQTGRKITVSQRAAMGFVTAEQLEGASSIVDSPTERTYLSEGDSVVLGFGEGDTNVGDRFTIFQVVDEVRDHGTNRILGHHVDVLGWLEVRELTGDTSIGEIRVSYSEMLRGVRIMSRPPAPRSVTVMQTPDANEGSIVFLPSSKTVMADGDYVYLNRGELDGLEVGGELEVVEHGGVHKDVPRGVHVQAPDHNVGTLVVVTLEPQTAVAYVVYAARELQVGDAVRPRMSKMAAR